MFIQTEAMPDTARMKFFPEQPFILRGSRIWGCRGSRDLRSPSVYSILMVSAVTFYDDFITVVQSEADWQVSNR